MFKVGDRVVCKALLQFGKVIEIDLYGTYPILVEWEDKTISTYTKDGHYLNGAPSSHDLRLAPLPTTTNLRPFNLSEAQAGRPVKFLHDYNNKNKVEYLCTLNIQHSSSPEVIFKITSANGEEKLISRGINGKAIEDYENLDDIVMAPIKTTWYGAHWSPPTHKNHRYTTNLYKDKEEVERFLKNSRYLEATYFTLEIEE